MEKNFSSALEPRLVSTMGTFAPIITPPISALAVTIRH